MRTKLGFLHGVSKCGGQRRDTLQTVQLAFRCRVF